jgi:ribosomal protein S18 acetylase RimI-like enzyme
MDINPAKDSFSFRRITRSILEQNRSNAFRAAQLIFDAAPQFYELIPLRQEETLKIIESLIGVQGGELESVHGLYGDEVPLAICSLLPSAKIAPSQMRSATSILQRLNKLDAQKFIASVRGFGKDVEKMNVDSIYVGRLAVDQAARGSGLGVGIIERILEMNPQMNYSLHVHRENVSAVRLYTKLRFKFQSDSDCAFRAMILKR